MQSHEHRLCLVNSSWIGNHELQMTLVCLVRLPLTYFSVVLGRDKYHNHHPPLILRVSVASALMDSNQHHTKTLTITALLIAITSFKAAIELWDCRQRCTRFQACCSLTLMWRWPESRQKRTHLQEFHLQMSSPNAYIWSEAVGKGSCLCAVFNLLEKNINSYQRWCRLFQRRSSVNSAAPRYPI